MNQSWNPCKKDSSKSQVWVIPALSICNYAKHMVYTTLSIYVIFFQICYGKINIDFIEHCFIVLSLFFSIVHCKPYLDIFIKRFVTTEPTKDVNSFIQLSSRASQQKYTSEGIEKVKGDVDKVMVLLEQDCPIWLCNITRIFFIRNPFIRN